MSIKIKIVFVALILFYYRCWVLNLFIGLKQINQYQNLIQNSYSHSKHLEKSVDLKLTKDVFRKEDFENLYRYFYDTNLQGNVSISEYLKWSISSKYHGYTYGDYLIHRYDDYNDLRSSGGPHTNNELCLKQLRSISDRVDRLTKPNEKFNSKDINLYLLMDSFGHPSAGQMSGNSLWLGSYSQCKKMNILIEDDETNNSKQDDKDSFQYFGQEKKYIKSKSRYCLASVLIKDWKFKSSSLADVMSIRTAICMPAACDSIDYKNKFELIEKLMNFNSRDIDKGELKVESLYCLPDDESPIRDWTKSKTTVATIVITSLWLITILYATLKSHFATSNKDDIENEENKLTTNNIYQLLSIEYNLKSLLNVQAKQPIVKNNTQVASSEEKTSIHLNNQSIVDLSIFDGIKVISLCYIIIGHVLMCLTTVLENGRDTAHTWSIAYQSSNMIPAFAVNSFFTITGILTTYFMFRENLKYNFLSAPINWLLIILHRYIRIMPMYLLVVLYTKTLAKYISSGPLWDYATSSISQRKLCEKESWLLTLLFKANTKNPVEQCIPSAWYLANDFQFLLITPIFLIALHKSENVGKYLLKLTISICIILGFLSIYLNPLEDLRPIAQFDPHGFKTYITFFHGNYVRFQYRLQSYLFGILIGYALFKYEQAKIKYLSMQQLKKSLETSGKLENSFIDETFKFNGPIHSSFSLNYGTILSLFFICLCAITPFVSTCLPRFNKPVARVLVSLFMPSYHILFSLSIGYYILLSSTGFGNKLLDTFLSSSYWKPFARVSLCAVLLNVEIINYIIQSSTKTWNLDGTIHFSLNVICIFWIYLVSFIAYVLFEAPLRNLLKHIFEGSIKRLVTKQKSD